PDEGREQEDEQEGRQLGGHRSVRFCTEAAAEFNRRGRSDGSEPMRHSIQPGPLYDARATSASARSRQAAEQKCSSRPATRSVSAPASGTYVRQTRSSTRSWAALTWRGSARRAAAGREPANAEAIVRSSSRSTSSQKSAWTTNSSPRIIGESGRQNSIFTPRAGR